MEKANGGPLTDINNIFQETSVVVPGVPIGTAIDAFSAAYANGAQKAGITFVDVRPPFLGHAYQWQSMKPGAGWLYDVVHPNDQGHDAIRGVFLAAIDPGFDTL